MSEGIKRIDQPRGKWPEDPCEGIGKTKGKNRPYIGFNIPALGTGSDDLYRVGGGGKLTVPISENLGLGLGYIYNFVPTDKTFKGHHFEMFLGLPKKLFWGQWRLGLFTELTSLTSWEEIRGGGGLSGIFVGVNLPIYNLGKNVDLQLSFEAGLGPEFKSFELGSLFLCGLEITIGL